MPDIILKDTLMAVIKLLEQLHLCQKKFLQSRFRLQSLKSFKEQIPNSSVSFNMVAIPGGSFKMGSPAGEPFRKNDEGPVINVEISPFFMAEIEVSWDEYLAFYKQTSGTGRSSDTEEIIKKRNLNVDVISGATPPYGS